MGTVQLRNCPHTNNNEAQNVDEPAIIDTTDQQKTIELSNKCVYGPIIESLAQYLNEIMTVIYIIVISTE